MKSLKILDIANECMIAGYAPPPNRKKILRC